MDAVEQQLRSSQRDNTRFTPWTICFTLAVTRSNVRTAEPDSFSRGVRIRKSHRELSCDEKLICCIDRCDEG